MVRTTINPYQIRGATNGAAIASQYNFSQSPGITLNPSGTIVMNPLPNGLAVGNPVYISGGTGTAETPTVSAINGNSVSFNNAFTHSGAYAIQSATAGILEAVIVAGSTGAVFIEPGQWKIYATITIPAAYQNFCLFGDGMYSSVLLNQSTSTDVIDWPATSGFVSMHNFGVIGQVGATAGWSFNIGGAVFGEIYNLSVRYGFNGMYLANPNSWLIHHIYGYGPKNIGMQVDATNGGVSVGQFSNIFFFTTYSLTDVAGLYMTTQTGGTFAGSMFENSFFIGGNAGVRAVLAAGTNMNEVIFDGCNITGTVYGLHITAHGATAYNWKLIGSEYVASIGTGGLGGPAISIDDGVKQFIVSESTIQCGDTFQCIDIQGSSYVNIRNNDIGSGFGPMIKIGLGNAVVASYISITGNNIGYALGNKYGTYGITTTADAHTNIFIGSDNRIFGGTAALQFQATGAGSRIVSPWIDPSSGASGKPTAAAAIDGSSWFTPGASGVSDLIEYCVKTGANAYVWASAVGKTLGSALTSGATVTLTDRTHHITAANTIQTLNAPPGLNPGEQVVLISDAGFGWNNAGNIAKAAAASPTVTNNTLILTWDGSHWY
jgi:hypothetical protein